MAGTATPLAAISAAVAAGADWVQLRARDARDQRDQRDQRGLMLTGRALLAWALAAREAARAGAAQRDDGARLRVLVNRRLDVALAAGADGVHLGFDAADPIRARAVLDDDGHRQRHRHLIGVSTHAPDELAAAARAGADYAHLAPIFAPLSKPAERPSLGPGALAAARDAGIPVLAQGGIDADNAGDVIRSGAAGVAVTGAVLLASDPGAAARALRSALDAAAA